MSSTQSVEELQGDHGGLNENGRHRPIGSGITRKSDLVEGDVALFEEVCL